MDFTLDGTQRQVLDSVERMLERLGGWAHHKAIIDANGYDRALHDELAGGGFLALPLTEGCGPLEAALVAERLAEDAAVVSAAATGLVYPMALGEAAPGPVAITASPGAPIRLAQFATTLLILSDDGAAMRLDLRDGDVSPANNDRTGWPIGRLDPAALSRATHLPPGAGERLRDWWRVGLALELAGAMRGAVRTTVAYVKGRVQFDRPIGSFQAIQHRLAYLTTYVEGAYWLALEAAYKDADTRGAAAAATHAAMHAPLVLRETQQMHGAIGFTREYPLHLWTMRLPVLQRELGGAMAHARAVARSLAAA